MLIYIIYLCIFMISLSMTAGLIRLVYGKNIIDRLIALDSLFLQAVALVIVLSMMWKSKYILESALLIAMFGFVSTIAIAKYVRYKSIMD